jgi:hypothetical protein
VAQAAKSERDFAFLLRDFLDGFNECPCQDKLADTPIWLSVEFDDSGRADAYLAAVAEHLSITFGLSAPEWVHDSRRFLPEPWFAAESDSAREFLRGDSPLAFRARNIFVSANALSRV